MACVVQILFFGCVHPVSYHPLVSDVKVFPCTLKVSMKSFENFWTYFIRKERYSIRAGVDLFLLLLIIHLISLSVGGFMSNLTLQMTGQTKLLFLRDM